MIANSHVLPKDFNNNAIQNGSGFLLHDATGTPITSPVTTGTSDVTLIFPANAIQLFVYLPTNDGRLKQGSNYITIPKQTYFGITGQPNDSVVLGRPSTTTIEFVFVILQ